MLASPTAREGTPTMPRTDATRHAVLDPSPASSSSSPPSPKGGHRETVEAVVVAFILALLVRGFEAEAFVIPTGSMAPTLMGRHKEVTCPQCGFVYAVNTSEEVEGGTGFRSSRPMVHTGICVNCRYQARIDREPSFKGDRILVMKFPYDLPFLPGASEPNRWDVVVFRYPEEPETSYIKRLVGRPGEVVRLWYGDVFIKSPGEGAFHQERKPLEHQRAMQMMVYDDAHRATALADRPDWRRWSSKTEGEWREASPGTFVSTASTGPDWSEFRYRHLVPDPEQWEALIAGQEPPRPPRSSLITDFYSYNTNLTARNSDLVSAPHTDQEGAWLQPHWVGDLTVSATLKVEALGGVVRFELIEGGISNRCEIDLTSGVATLFHGAESLGEKPSGIEGSGRHAVTFANVDNRLTLWVDDRPVFGEGLTYEDGTAMHPVPTEADLSPVGIASRGASVAVSDLVLKRDIYYTQKPGPSDYGEVWDGHYPRNPVELFNFLSDPSRFALLGGLRPSEYAIGPDRFLMMGDNSPRSRDSRGWNNRDRLNPDDPDSPDSGWDRSDRESWEVPRALLTGKAFFVYWPHGKPFGPDIRLNHDFRIPFRPYVERMRWIR